MGHIKRVLTLIIIITFIPSCKKTVVSSEVGNIEGVVIDDSTSASIEGVIVRLDSAKIDTTDHYGQFYFEDIEEGEHTLSFSKYPYRDTTLTVQVKSENTSTLYIRLKNLGPARWEVVDSIGDAIVQVFFVDYYNGWLLSGGDGIWWGDKIYRTTDGEHFILIHQFSEDDSIRKIFFVNNNIGWAVGMKIWKTEDGGNTWVEQMNVDSTYNSQAYGSYFYNEDEGFVVGGGQNTLYNRDFVLHTTDGGTTWIPIEPWESDNSNLYALFDIKMNNDWGVIVGQHVYSIWEWLSSGSFYTISRGEEWEYSSEGFGDEMGHPPFHRVTLYGNGRAIKIWRGGLLAAISEDMGRSWSLLDTLNAPAYDVVFIDDSHGWLASEEGIYFTRDEGITWESQWTGDTVTSLYMLDANWGYAGTHNGVILRYERVP